MCSYKQGTGRGPCSSRYKANAGCQGLQFYFWSRGEAEAQERVRAGCPTVPAQPLSHQSLMQVKKLETKAGAIIKLFKDFANQRTPRAASRVTSLRNSPPTWRQPPCRVAAKDPSPAPAAGAPVRGQNSTQALLWKGGIPFPSEHKSSGSSRIHA